MEGSAVFRSGFRSSKIEIREANQALILEADLPKAKLYREVLRDVLNDGQELSDRIYKQRTEQVIDMVLGSVGLD